MGETLEVGSPWLLGTVCLTDGVAKI